MLGPDVNLAPQNIFLKIVLIYSEQMIILAAQYSTSLAQLHMPRQSPAQIFRGLT